MLGSARAAWLGIASGLAGAPETTYEEDVLALGALAGYWPMHESGGGVAVDHSGNGRDGTYTGAITYQDPGLVVAGQNSAYFSVADDNTNNGIEVADDPVWDMGAGGTWAFWFKRPAGAGFFHLFMSRWDQVTNGWFVWMDTGDNVEVYFANAGVSYTLKYVGATYRDATRNLLVVTMDGSKFVRINVNGVDVASGTSTVFPGTPGVASLLRFNSDWQPINSQGWLAEGFILPGVEVTQPQAASLYAKGIA